MFRLGSRQEEKLVERKERVFIAGGVGIALENAEAWIRKQGKKIKNIDVGIPTVHSAPNEHDKEKVIITYEEA